MFNFLIFQHQLGRFLMLPRALIGMATLVNGSGPVGYLNLVKFIESQNPQLTIT